MTRLVRSILRAASQRRRTRISSPSPHSTSASCARSVIDDLRLDDLGIESGRGGSRDLLGDGLRRAGGRCDGAAERVEELVAALVALALRLLRGRLQYVVDGDLLGALADERHPDVDDLVERRVNVEVDELARVHLPRDLG